MLRGTDTISTSVFRGRTASNFPPGVHVCQLFPTLGPLKKDWAPVADCFALACGTHVAVRPHLQQQRKFCRLPFALGCYATKIEASRFRFLSPNWTVPRSFAPTSGTDKVRTFTPAQAMAVPAVPSCLLSEHGRDREGQAEGSLLIFLSLSCMEDPVAPAL